MESIEFVAPSTKLKSSVWQYFGFYKMKGSEQTHFDRTLCKLCNNLLAYNSGCTTNMRYHLIRSHKIEPEQLLFSDIKQNATTVKRVHDAKETKSTRKHGWLEKVDEDLFEFVPAPASLKALVWQHFGFYKKKGTDKAEYDRTWCKLCDHFMVYSGGNTTNMRSHLSRHHDIQLESLSTSLTVTTSPQSVEINKKLFSDTELWQLSDKKFSEEYEFVPAKPHLKALVWNYFGFYKEKDTDDTRFDKTCCKLCKTMLKYTGGCTTNMRSHLQRAHHLDIQSSTLSKCDVSAVEGGSTRTVRELKKILKKQSCGNSSCNRPIKLEPDGSPPQFCAGCGLLLSTSLSELWSVCTECCQLCGKIKESSSEAHFCSRCGGYLADEVEVFPHNMDVDVKADNYEPEEMDLFIETSSELSLSVSKGESVIGAAGDSQSPVEESEVENYLKHSKMNEKEASHESDDAASSGSNSTGNESDSDSPVYRDCDFCNFKAADDNEFSTHLRMHFDMDVAGSQSDGGESNGLFGVAVDDQKDRLHDLIEHIKEQKQSKTDPDWDPDLSEDMAEQESVWQCAYCNYECEQKETLDEHLATHKTEGSKSAKHIVRYCKKCNEEFETLSLLREHEKAASCKGKVLACDECDFMTTKVDSFRGHKRRNHGEIILRKCDYCDRMFKRQRNLEEHMNTHTGSTPFQCDKCGKAFHTNSSWYKHKRNNCEPGPRERKLCSHCGRAVINLSKHISDVHFNIKDFHCETCSKSFGTQYHLDRHVRIHTGEKPFPCQYCDYRASQKVVTEGHMKKCKSRPVRSDVADATNT